MKVVCIPGFTRTDNATKFTSEEFRHFLKKNGIRHVLTPPYHSAWNGLAERAVQTFKEGMKKLSEGSLETKLSRFLFKYHITRQSSTGVAPAELMFGRRLRSHLDDAHPDLSRKARMSQEHQKQSHDVRARSREFTAGLCAERWIRTDSVAWESVQCSASDVHSRVGGQQSCTQTL